MLSVPHSANGIAVSTFICLMDHCPKLEAQEYLSILPDTPLPEDHWSWTVELDGQPQTRKDWRKRNEGNDADNNIQQTLSDQFWLHSGLSCPSASQHGVQLALWWAAIRSGERVTMTSW